MKVKVMPIGYDPVVARASCTKDKNWTPELAALHRKMEDDAPIIEVDDDWKCPAGHWWYEVKEKKRSS